MNLRTLVATLVGVVGSGPIIFDPNNPQSVRVAGVIGALVLLAVHTLAVHWHLINETNAATQVATAKSTLAAANAQAAATSAAAGLADVLGHLTGPPATATPSSPGADGPALIPVP